MPTLVRTRTRLSPGRLFSDIRKAGPAPKPFPADYPEPGA